MRNGSLFLAALLGSFFALGQAAASTLTLSPIAEAGFAGPPSQVLARDGRIVFSGYFAVSPAGGTGGLAVLGGDRWSVPAVWQGAAVDASAEGPHGRFFVATGNTVRAVDGGAITDLPPLTYNVTTLHWDGVGQRLFAAGTGRVSIWSGSAWVSSTLPAWGMTVRAFAVRPTDGAVFAGLQTGTDGAVLRLEGNAWSLVPGLSKLNGVVVVWSESDASIVAAGSPAPDILRDFSAGIVRLGDSGWTPLLPPPSTTSQRRNWLALRSDARNRRLLALDTQRQSVFVIGASEARPLASVSNAGFGPKFITAFDVDPLDGRLYASGELGLLSDGSAIGHVAAWGGAGWQPLDRGPRDGGVRKVAFDRAGNRHLAAGTFSSIGGVPAPGFAVRSNGTWHGIAAPTAFTENDSVRSFDWDGVRRQLVLAAIGPTGRRFWRRPEGGPWISVPPPAGAGNTLPLAFDTERGELYVLSDRATIQVLRGDVWHPLATHPTLTLGGGAWDPVRRRVVTTGHVSSASPYTRHIVALEESGQWTTLGTITQTRGVGTGLLIEDLAVNPVDGRIAVVGNFEAVSGVRAENVAVLDGGTWRALGSGTTGAIYDASWSGRGDFLLLDGPFTAAGGVPAAGTALWSAAGWSALPKGAQGWIYDMRPDPSGAGVLVGGALALPTGEAASVGLLDVSDGAGWPRLRAGSVAVVEGHDPEREVFMPVDLDRPAPPGGTEVAWRTEDGTATSLTDYVSASGTVRISAGERQGLIVLRIRGDRVAESQEEFRVIFGPVQRGVLETSSAVVTIIDDDEAALPHLAARPDRFTVSHAGETYSLAVLANDYFERARIVGGSLSIVRQPDTGRASIFSPTPNDGDASNDAIALQIPNGQTAPLRFRYRLCETGGRCSEAEAEVTIQASASIPQTFSGAREVDVRDINVTDLPSMNGALFEAFGLVKAWRQQAAVGVDLTPEDIWDVGGTHTFLRQLRGDRGGSSWRTFVDVSGADVDVHIGIDTNSNGRADAAERLCSTIAAASADSRPPRCALTITATEGQSVQYWVHVQRRSGMPASIGTSNPSTATSMDAGTLSRSLRATGPAVVGATATRPVRLSWDTPDALPGDALGGWVRLRHAGSGYESWWPMRVGGQAFGPMPRPITLGRSPALVIANRAQARSLMLDSPHGLSGLSLTFSGDGEFDVRITHAPPQASSNAVPHLPTPQPDAAVVVASSVGGRVVATVPDALARTAGRFWITVTNRASDALRFDVDVQGTGSAKTIAPGAYFNPERSGHGVFLYPAGPDLAGLWYTYDDAAQPTWYYLQGPAANAKGAWRGDLYRSVWLGDRNVLTAVGEAVVTPLENGDVVYTYALDGRFGTERLIGFGSGCPSVSGSVVDASGHWFDPRRAGMGYSTQFFADYEFHAAFVYDASGLARFVTAEAPGPIVADRTLRLEQLEGFCPLCERLGAPRRRAVGTLQRRIAGERVVQMAPDLRFAAPLMGAHAQRDDVMALGSTQGCR
jgi:hypothetical protein